MTFADKIKHVRGELLISQEQLAHAIGVSFSTINRLEGGRNQPTLATQRAFKEYCDEKGIKFDNKGVAE